jgi:DNA-directed RNA polymerase specialized sigma24 family protein
MGPPQPDTDKTRRHAATTRTLAESPLKMAFIIGVGRCGPKSFNVKQNCEPAGPQIASNCHRSIQSEGTVSVLTRDVFREEPIITELAFGRLLQWLDDGVESHGERYLEMRRRLVSYFDRRDCATADELADETFNRIAKTLETSVIATRPPARYCYVVARFVLLENFRTARRHVPLDEPRSLEISLAHGIRLRIDETAATREQRLDCLDHCLQELRPEQRELAIEYYRDARRQRIDRRQALAGRLGISINALGIRACRLRDALKACVEGCRKDRRQI